VKRLQPALARLYNARRAGTFRSSSKCRIKSRQLARRSFEVCVDRGRRDDQGAYTPRLAWAPLVMESRGGCWERCAAAGCAAGFERVGAQKAAVSEIKKLPRPGGGRSARQARAGLYGPDTCRHRRPPGLPNGEGIPRSARGTSGSPTAEAVLAGNPAPATSRSPRRARRFAGWWMIVMADVQSPIAQKPAATHGNRRRTVRGTVAGCVPVDGQCRSFFVPATSSPDRAWRFGLRITDKFRRAASLHVLRRLSGLKSTNSDAGAHARHTGQLASLRRQARTRPSSPARGGKASRAPLECRKGRRHSSSVANAGPKPLFPPRAPIWIHTRGFVRRTVRACDSMERSRRNHAFSLGSAPPASSKRSSPPPTGRNKFSGRRTDRTRRRFRR